MWNRAKPDSLMHKKGMKSKSFSNSIWYLPSFSAAIRNALPQCSRHITYIFTLLPSAVILLPHSSSSYCAVAAVFHFVQRLFFVSVAAVAVAATPLKNTIVLFVRLEYHAFHVKWSLLYAFSQQFNRFNDIGIAIQPPFLLSLLLY